MAESESPKIPKCRCGHGRDHHLVSAETDHTFIGWIALMFGISAPPIRINYRCRRCDRVFESTTDPDVLGKYYDR